MSLPRWLIPVVILAAMVPSVILACLATMLHIAKDDAQPFLASTHIDADAATRTELATAGQVIHLKIVPGGLEGNRGTFTLPITVLLQRADDPTCDLKQEWPIDQPHVEVSVPRPGRWRVLLQTRADHHDVALTDVRIDIPAKNSPPSAR